MHRIVRYQYPRPTNLFSGRSPWAGLESEIDRLFETAFTQFATPAFARQAPVDLYQDKENTYARVELPGFNREDISLELVEGFLNLTAARKAQGSETEEARIQRAISVPETVQTDKVTATFENGVLTVTLPKQEVVKPKKVTVAIN